MAVRTNILLKLSNFVDSLITFAKLQNIATNKILGRTTAGSGVIEELDIANYSNQLIPLTTTFADAENIGLEVDIVTVTVPANTLAVGDLFIIDFGYLRLQNSGAAINIAMLLKNNGLSMFGINSSVANSASQFNVNQRHKLRVFTISGTTATFTGPAQNGSATAEVNTHTSNPTAVTAGAINATYSNNTVDITVTNTFTITAQWATANANAWIRGRNSQAYIIKKAV